MNATIDLPYPTLAEVSFTERGIFLDPAIAEEHQDVRHMAIEEALESGYWPGFVTIALVDSLDDAKKAAMLSTVLVSTGEVMQRFSHINGVKCLVIIEQDADECDLRYIDLRAKAVDSNAFLVAC